MRHLGDNIHKGDVILSNHPAAGGSHLPDLTVITPVGLSVTMVFPIPLLSVCCITLLIVCCYVVTN